MDGLETMLDGARYLGSYLTLIGILVLVVLVVQLINIPPPTEAENRQPQRPLRKIMAQPAFVIAVMSAVLWMMMRRPAPAVA